MSSILAKFWNLRRSTNPSDRLIWWLVVLGSLVIVLIPALLEVQMFLLLWYGGALLLSIVPVVWGFYHREAMWQALAPARNWAAGLGLLCSLIFYSLAQQKVLWPSLELLTFGAFMLVFTILFLIFFLLHMVGASIGIMAGTGMPDLGATAQRGVHAWGFGLLLLVFLPGFNSPDQFEGFYLFLKCSVPIVTLILCLLARTPELNPHMMLMRWVRWLERRLIFRWTRERSVLFFDFRGAALGGLAGILALLMSVTGVFVPLQLQTLGPLTRLRNSNEALKNFYADRESPTNASRVVLVQLDLLTRSLMMTEVSETRVQAAAIRRLQELEVGAIILPIPLLEPAWLNQRQSEKAVTDYEAPAPDPESIERSRRDLPNLISAIESSGKVILATHGLTSGNSDAQKLRKASRAEGTATLGIYKIGNIKTIPTSWIETPPLPYLIANQLDPVAWRIPKLNENQMVPFFIPGAHDPVIVNYESIAGNREFTRTTYATLMQTNQLFVIPPLPEAGSYPKALRDWMPGNQFFKDKIVFLDSIAWNDQLTPIGPINMNELMAHAGLTLVNHTYVQKARLPVDILITLLFGLLAGHLCLRRDPFRASWRIGLAVFVLVLGIIFTFVLHLVWVDPVLPLVAAVLAFMLVTQFTFSLEHVELQHNRSLLQRFVAPQVVEELLADPENMLGLGGRRQRICVLFADVRNFTPYAERHTSEEVIETINTYMTALTEALHAYGGLLDKYTGDGLMALFRVTHENPDEEIQEAVLAALAMRDVCKTVSKRMQEQGKEALQVGVSMHYGEAVVGLVGNPNQFNYTALGHTVVVAARLNSVTPPGEVLVSDTVFQAIAETFTVEECEEVMVKGLSLPVRPYRVIKPHHLVRKTRLTGLLGG